MAEIWKDIEGYEGLYKVSTLGRVKSLSNNKTKKEKILKPVKDRYGYLHVSLSKKGILKPYRIHRLVAQTFIHNPNPNHYTQVNHIDENKSNNNVNNLEWCTAKYNSNYGTRNERISKPVIGINKINGYIVEYSSIMEVERCLGIDQGNIVKCCQGKIKSVGGYRWIYANSNNEEDKQNE